MISKTHFYYIVSILLTIIILLISAKFGSDQNLVNYISFALTLTSLILALVSIVYSFYSNSSFSDNISALNNATNSMTDTSSKLVEITSKLNDKLDEVPYLIKGIEGKIDFTYQYLEKSYEVSQNTVNTEEIQSTFASNLVDNFIETTSVSGLFLLYALCISEQKNKPFELQDLCENIDIFEFQYCFGYIVASVSFGLFSQKSENNYLIISNMVDGVINRIKTKIEILASEDLKVNKNDLLKQQINKIENYFV